MPRRDFLTIEARGQTFRFYYERDSRELHIKARHGTSDEEAIATFFGAIVTTWDEVHLRWESLSETHLLYWARHPFDDSVVIISCMRLEESNG